MAAQQYFFNNAATIVAHVLNLASATAFITSGGITWRVGLTCDETTAYTFVATDSVWTDIGNSRLDVAAGLSGGYTVPSADSWAESITVSTDTVSMDWTVLPNWATVDTTASGNIDGCAIIANCDLGSGLKDYLWSWHRPASVIAMNGSNIDLSWASSIPWDLELPNA